MLYSWYWFRMVCLFLVLNYQEIKMKQNLDIDILEEQKLSTSIYNFYRVYQYFKF